MNDRTDEIQTDTYYVFRIHLLAATPSFPKVILWWQNTDMRNRKHGTFNLNNDTQMNIHVIEYLLCSIITFRPDRWLCGILQSLVRGETWKDPGDKSRSNTRTITRPGDDAWNVCIFPSPRGPTTYLRPSQICLRSDRREWCRQCPSETTVSVYKIFKLNFMRFKGICWSRVPQKFHLKRDHWCIL